MRHPAADAAVGCDSSAGVPEASVFPLARRRITTQRIDGNNFGLDTKDPKNKKIISDVTKIMLDGLQGFEDRAEFWNDAMEELDKVLTDPNRLT